MSCFFFDNFEGKSTDAIEMTNSDTEKKLLYALVEGDENAFCELYAIYKSRLIYFAMQYLKSADFAEDVYQDAFASVWQNRHFINPDQPFAPYIYTIIKNRILNLLADIKKEESLKQILLSNAIDYDDSADTKLLIADYEGLLEKALLKLTPQQRKVFEMSRKAQKSHKEIAEELDLSLYTVQQHISTALRIIREYLQKNEGLLPDIILLLFCLNI